MLKILVWESAFQWYQTHRPLNQSLGSYGNFKAVDLKKSPFLGHHSGDPRGVPRGDLRVVYVILMTEMILEGDSCEKSCWK